MRRRVQWTASILFLGLTCLCFGASEKQGPPPVPRSLSLESPDPSLPDQLKALAGKWVGSWDAKYGWDTVLYVEKIDRDSAQVVLSWGDYNTSKNSCHCNPNWVRVQKAEVKQGQDGITLHFFTPKFRPKWLKVSHVVNGTGGEYFGADNRNSGQYTFEFVADKSDPATLKGLFFSAKQSRLRVNLKKVDEQDGPSAQ